MKWWYMYDGTYVRNLHDREWEMVQVFIASPLMNAVCHLSVDLDDYTDEELDYACKAQAGFSLEQLRCACWPTDRYLAFYMMHLRKDDHWEDSAIYTSLGHWDAHEFAKNFRNDQREVS